MRTLHRSGHYQSLTYLLTFGCYGTHLPGDERGSVDRARGDHRGGAIQPSELRQSYAKKLMEHSPYKLAIAQAGMVLDAIREVCTFRGWELLAAHVRSTHVHVVIDRVEHPNLAIRDFKAYASRALNRLEYCERRWAREGSTRTLRTDEAVLGAVRYVADGQGEPWAVYVLQRSDPPD